MMLDSHQHFWQVARGDYGWLVPQLAPLYRDFNPADLAPLMARAGITRTILVQAAQTEAETDFLLTLADQTPFVAGVVGWLDMDSADFPQRLAHYRANPHFVGLRPMLQELAQDDWILRPQVLANLKRVADAGLPFDILSFPRHLGFVKQALQQVPHLRAVVDHISKPDIKNQAASPTFEAWKSGISALAALPQVSCKLSGMVTEASAQWRPQDFVPYVDHVVRAFGPDRLMFGSDWPVCTLHASYAEVCNLLRTLLAKHFGPEALHKVFETNAARFYGVAP